MRKRLCLLFIDSCGGRGHLEQPDDGRALCSLINAVPSADVIRRDASLPVGRPCQRHQRLLSGDEMPDFHRISHRIDVRDRSPHMLIDHNGTLLPQCKACLPCKARLRKDTCRHQDKIGPDAFFFRLCLL